MKKNYFTIFLFFFRKNSVNLHNSKMHNNLLIINTPHKNAENNSFFGSTRFFYFYNQLILNIL
jgi:hypothetical protein